MNSEIVPGTVVRFACDPADVSWQVVRFVEHVANLYDEWDSYRCKQIGGDTALYLNSRNADGTIDFASDDMLIVRDLIEEDNGMSEHGATDAVIEAVAMRLCGDLDDSADQLPDRPCDGCLAEVRKVVNLLAKAGHGIYWTADVEALAEFVDALTIPANNDRDLWARRSAATKPAIAASKRVKGERG